MEPQRLISNDAMPGGIPDGPELTIPALFETRVNLTPEATAYLVHNGKDWQPVSWRAMAERVERLRAALRSAGLAAGDRVGLCLPNGIDWIASDVAVMSAGLVPVPLYIRDSAENIGYVIGDADVRLCITDTPKRWSELVTKGRTLGSVRTVWVLEREVKAAAAGVQSDPRINAIPSIEGEARTGMDGPTPISRDSLATIVYTSGTTGPPKGVMLTHQSILSNAQAIMDVNSVSNRDIFLSLLPLAHAFERTIGCYVPIMGGATVAFNREVTLLAEDLAEVRPTVLLAVPRLFERIAAEIRTKAATKSFASSLLNMTEKIGWQRFISSIGDGDGPGLTGRVFWSLIGRRIARRICEFFGGRLRIVLSGGAPLSSETSHFMLAMGVPLIEGYGLTEAGPAVTGSTLEDRRPGSVGRALPNVEVKLGERNELLVRSPGTMIGYWKKPDATAEVLDDDGWLHTGDVADLCAGRVYINGRIKDILVLSTGENVNPLATESALAADPLIDQVCVVGDGRPSCSAIVVPVAAEWRSFARSIGSDVHAPNTPEVRMALLERLAPRMATVPEFARVRDIYIELLPWSLESGLITPTLKPKRKRVAQAYDEALSSLATPRR
jgi:long-chain acyl-CoA synthetase